MRAIWQSFMHDAGGQIALSFAGGAIVLTIMASMAIDTSQMSSQQNNLQLIADETAIALAVEINVVSQTRENLNDIAQARVEAQLQARGDTTPARVTAQSLRTGPAMHPRDRSHDTIDISISQHSRSGLMNRFFGSRQRTMQVHSRARRLGSHNLCVVALNRTLPNTLLLRDSARLTAPNCDIISNSSDPDGLNVADAAKMVAKEIHSAGGASGQAINFSPEPITDSLSLADPLATIPEPPTSPCGIITSTPINGLLGSLQPGIYCFGLVVSGNRSLTMQPGVYTFLDDVRVEAGSELTGTGVTLHFAGGDSRLIVEEGAGIRLSAPESGSTAGLLVFESHNNSEGNVHTISSSDARYLVGTIYVPRGVFKINTDAPVSDQSEYTAIVARRLLLHDNSNLYLNTDYDATNVPTPPGVGPIDRGVRLEQ